MTTTAERRPAAEPDGAHTRKKDLEHSAPVPAPSSLTYKERIARVMAAGGVEGARARMLARLDADLRAAREPGEPADWTGETIPAPAITTNIADGPPDWTGSRYVRIYASTKTDPKFADVRDDPLRWATWTWLLQDADDAWPQPAHVARRIKQDALDHLVSVGLVDLLPDDRYLMHGLDAERRARTDPASEGGKRSVRNAVRDPSNGRWMPRQPQLDTPPTPVGHATNPSWTSAQLARARAGAEQEQSRSKSTVTSSRKDDLKEADEPEGPAISWLATHGAALAPNGGKLHQMLCRLVEVHGIDRVVATFEEMTSASEATEAGQYVLGASNRLNPIPGRRPKSSGDHLPTVQEAEDAFEKF